MAAVRRASIDGDGRQRVWTAWFMRGVALLGLVVGASTLSILLGRFWWLLEVVSHFRIQSLIALSACAVVLRVGGRSKLALACAGLALIHVALALPLYLPKARSGPADGPEIRLLSFNVNGQNREHERTREVIRSSRADVVTLFEVTPGLARTLAPLTSEYRFHRLHAQPGSFGIGIYSRFPIAEAALLPIGEPSKPAMRMALETDAGPLTLIATHTMPPKGHAAFLERNSQLSDLATLAAAVEGPRVVVGDLNLSSWSPFFADLVRESGLRDSRRGFGVQPTWPARNPLLWIPIDHVLISDQVIVVARAVGPAAGSDHRSVLCVIALADG